MNPATSLTDLLRQTLLQGASDLHLSAHQPMMMRLHGVMTPIALPPPDDATVRAWLQSIMSQAQYDQWCHRMELDFAIELDGVARFRVNAFHHRLGAGAVFRCIANQPPTLESLNAPPIFAQLCQKKQGLILVTGATGSGKSTTLAAMIDHINRHQASHILTIEDPIEFIHQSKRSLVNQREVYKDTLDFQLALKAALREDPDVILVGELRDAQTVRLALTAAETGHLVLATLHTNSAAKSIDRLVDVFDSQEKPLIATMLSECLQAVIAQKLLPNTQGGRTAIHEIMIATPAIKNLIREHKTHQIPSMIGTGAAFGMSSFEHGLKHLLAQGKISQAVAKDVLEQLH